MSTFFLYACPECGSTVYSPLTPDEFDAECKNHYPAESFEWVEKKEKTA